MTGKSYTWLVAHASAFGALLLATLLAQSCVLGLRDPRVIRVHASAAPMRVEVAAAVRGYSLPDIGPPPMPPVDLPIPLRWVPSVKQTLDGVYKAAYALGLADGFGAGLTVGEAGGQVVGFLLGLSLVFGLTLIAGVIYRCFFYRPPPPPPPPMVPAFAGYHPHPFGQPWTPPR